VDQSSTVADAMLLWFSACPCVAVARDSTGAPFAFAAAQVCELYAFLLGDLALPAIYRTTRCSVYESQEYFLLDLFRRKCILLQKKARLSKENKLRSQYGANVWKSI
jgi:hypothetical protein